MRSEVRQRFERLEKVAAALVCKDQMAAMAGLDEIAERNPGALPPLTAKDFAPPPPPFKFEVGQEVTCEHMSGVVVGRHFDGKRNMYQFGSPVTHHWCEEHLRASASPPPARFRVGDWVRAVKTDDVGRIVFTLGIDNDPEHYNVLWSDGDVERSLQSNHLEPWQPRIGELVMERQSDGGWKTLMFGQPHNYAGIIPAPLGPQAEEWFK
jgi:hypothetical protein